MNYPHEVVESCVSAQYCVANTMAQIKDEKISDTSLNGPNAHHGPNANHKPKEEFHGGGRGGRGNRFQPYGGPNRDRKGGPPRDNMVIIYYVVIKY